MVAHRVGTQSADARLGVLARLDCPLDHFADVQYAVAEPLRIFHGEAACRRADDAGVADLPALLGVEAGTVEQERASSPT